MKRKAIRNLLIASACIAVSVCGGMSVAAEEVVELRLTQWEGGETLAIYEAFAEKFNAEHPNIHLTIENIPEEYDTKLMAMFAAGNPPELGMMESATLLMPWAEEGIVLNLQDFIDNDPDFNVESMGEQFTYRLSDDYIAGYGMGIEDVCMFYDPFLFEKYGVEEPPAKYSEAWDWETFVHNAQLLTIDKNGKNALDPEFDPENIDVYGISFGRWWVVYMPFLHSIDDTHFITEEGTVGYATEAGRIAFQNLQDLIYKYHVAPTPVASETLPGTTEQIAAHKAAMVIDGQWYNATLMLEDIDYNVAALPKMGDNARTIRTCSALSIFDTEKKDAAWEVVKAIISDVGMCEALHQSGLWMPHNMLEYTDEYLQGMLTDKHPSNYYDAIIAPVLDGTAGPTPTMYTKNFSVINSILDPALDDLWSGEKTADEVMDGIEAEANSEVQGFYGK